MEVFVNCVLSAALLLSGSIENLPVKNYALIDRIEDQNIAVVEIATANNYYMFDVPVSLLEKNGNITIEEKAKIPLTLEKDKNSYLVKYGNYCFYEL